MLADNEPAQKAFWAKVADNPDEFVNSARVGKGTVFRNPEDLNTMRFHALYAHVYRCSRRADRKDVPEDERFEYHQPAIDRGRAEWRATRTNAKVKGKAAAAATAV